MAPRIGLALAGGFARGIAHIGVLQTLEQHGIPIACVAGVSAGAMVAAAYASGRAPEDIARIGRSLRFADVARWTIGWMGLAASERMERFLRKLLKCYTFEEMATPLSVVATDVRTGEPVVFRDRGNVLAPIRASCSYPGLFQPVRFGERLLVDGAMSMEVPALLAKQMGATHVISVHLPILGGAGTPQNLVQVVRRCFQILHDRTQDAWRQHSDLIIEPDVCEVQWDGFASAGQLMEAGRKAAIQAMPRIREWLGWEAGRGGSTRVAPRESCHRLPC
jgi:NTE family protein